MSTGKTKLSVSEYVSGTGGTNHPEGFVWQLTGCAYFVAWKLQHSFLAAVDDWRKEQVKSLNLLELIY